MLLKIFEIDGRKPIPSEACYIVPWLKRIMDLYPEDYIQIYSYIFFTACSDGTNPYINFPEEDREDVIISDLKPLKFSLEDPIIIDTLKRCIKIYETPTLRIWKGAKVMLDQMADDLRTKKLTYGKDGNESAMRGMMDKIAVYTKNYMEVEKMLQEEQSKVKGDRVIPYHQKAGYKETRNYGQDEEDEQKKI